MRISQVHAIMNHSALETNQLLAALPREGLKRLLPHLTAIRISKNHILYEAGRFITTDGYFLSSGLVSLVATTKRGYCVFIS